MSLLSLVSHQSEKCQLSSVNPSLSLIKTRNLQQPIIRVDFHEQCNCGEINHKCPPRINLEKGSGWKESFSLFVGRTSGRVSGKFSCCPETRYPPPGRLIDVSTLQFPTEANKLIWRYPNLVNKAWKKVLWALLIRGGTQRQDGRDKGQRRHAHKVPYVVAITVAASQPSDGDSAPSLEKPQRAAPQMINMEYETQKPRNKIHRQCQYRYKATGFTGTE